jgi:hypothetical protein
MLSSTATASLPYTRQAGARAVGALDVSLDGAKPQVLVVSLPGAHLNPEAWLSLNLRPQDKQVRIASYLIWRPPQKRWSAPPRRAHIDCPPLEEAPPERTDRREGRARLP